MSDRKSTTETLGRMLVRDVFKYPDPRIYWASEVTFDYISAHPVRVDFMRFKPRNTSISGLESGEVHCFEVKSCVADFNSGHGLNFLGDRNYIVCPPELVEYVKDHTDWDIGIYTIERYQYSTRSHLANVRPAKRMNRSRPITECLYSMMRSLQREAIKQWPEPSNTKPEKAATQ